MRYRSLAEVSDPEDTLDSHHRFSNDLTSSGGNLLAEMLGDVTYAGVWAAQCSGLLPNSVNLTHKPLDPLDQPQVSTGQTVKDNVVLSFGSGWCR